MSTQCRLARARLGTRPRGKGAGRFRPGRLIPILLALYLTPALLVVLLVGGVGMLVLAAARAITSLARGPEVVPARGDVTAGPRASRRPGSP
jgi:hypothetical protein